MDMSKILQEGGCLCGAIRYRIEGKPFDAYLTFDKDFRTVYGFPPRTDKPKGKERRR
jgi:hypothetical protein